MKKDYRKLDLERLEIDDYKILIVALNNVELYHLEITEDYLYKLISKLEKNLNKLEYNNKLDE